jgi:WD40 repeat protein
VVNRANFSADGSKIVTASDDKTARVWDVKGNLIAEIRGHTGVVNRANFNADGSKIVTASNDLTAWAWKANFENDFDRLLIGVCEKLSDYLATNPNVSNEERQACQVKR